MSLDEQDRSGSTSALEVLLFALAERRFALALRDVFEVVRAVTVRELPSAPNVVRGVIDLRGVLLPVLDLRARFGLASIPIALDHNFIIAQAGPRRVALMVDRALDLTVLAVTPLERAGNLPADLGHLAGIAATEDGLVLIYDLARFLRQAEESQLAAALHAAEPAA